MNTLYTGLAFDPWETASLNISGTAVFWTQDWTYNNQVHKYYVTQNGAQWDMQDSFASQRCIGIAVDNVSIYCNTRDLPAAATTSIFRYNKAGTQTGTINMDALDGGGDSYFGEGIFVYDNHLYLNDETGDEILVVDITNWASPVLDVKFAGFYPGNFLANNGSTFWLGDGGATMHRYSIKYDDQGNIMTPVLDTGQQSPQYSFNWTGATSALTAITAEVRTAPTLGKGQVRAGPHEPHYDQHVFHPDPRQLHALLRRADRRERKLQRVVPRAPRRGV
jgi:hypothetical protein